MPDIYYACRRKNELNHLYIDATTISPTIEETTVKANEKDRQWPGFAKEHPIIDIIPVKFNALDEIVPINAGD